MLGVIAIGWTDKGRAVVNDPNELRLNHMTGDGFQVQNKTQIKVSVGSQIPAGGQAVGQ